MAAAQAEQDRVERIAPPPWTDAALCAAEQKVIDEAGYLIFHAHDEICSIDPDALLNAASEANRGANITAGLYHCSH